MPADCRKNCNRNERIKRPIKKAMLVGLKIENITSDDHSSATIKFENGHTVFLYALPLNGGTPETSVIEDEDTDPEWADAYYGWKPSNQDTADRIWSNLNRPRIPHRCRTGDREHPPDTPKPSQNESKVVLKTFNTPPKKI